MRNYEGVRRKSWKTTPANIVLTPDWPKAYLCDRLKYCRLKKQLKASEVRELIIHLHGDKAAKGFSASQILRWERYDSKPPTIDQLGILAKTYAVSFVWMVSRTGPRIPEKAKSEDRWTIDSILNNNPSLWPLFRSVMTDIIEELEKLDKNN